MKIVVFGAGSIGCYIGGHLIAAGCDVHLVGREKMATVLQSKGMQLTHYENDDVNIAVSAISCASSLSAFSAAQCEQVDVVLLTVKSKDTIQAAEQIRPFLNEHTVVVSLQNGVSNADKLKQALPEHAVYAGMVPFNVVNHLHEGSGHFHCGTEGEVVLDAQCPSALIQAFEQSAIPCKTHDDMQGVLWGKLLLNLNNAINVLSNLPLLEQLQQRAYRQVLAASMQEALRVFKAADIQVVKASKVSPSLLPYLLSSPDVLFKRLSQSVLKIDPAARSSMWEDLQQGREPEVDYINGEIVRLAESINCKAPINQLLCDLVNEAFEQRKSPEMSGLDLLSRVQAIKKQA